MTSSEQQGSQESAPQAETAGEYDTFVVRAVNSSGDYMYLMPSGRWTSLLREALHFEAKGASEVELRLLASVPLGTGRLPRRRRPAPTPSEPGVSDHRVP